MEDSDYIKVNSDLIAKECTLGEKKNMFLRIKINTYVTHLYLIRFDFIADYINYHRLQQDHFCVIEIIRKNYLNQPAPETESLVLRNPQTVDASAGQAGAILRHLNNEASFLKGFFF